MRRKTPGFFCICTDDAETSVLSATDWLVVQTEPLLLSMPRQCKNPHANIAAKFLPVHHWQELCSSVLLSHRRRYHPLGHSADEVDTDLPVRRRPWNAVIISTAQFQSVAIPAAASITRARTHARTHISVRHYHRPVVAPDAAGFVF